MSTMATKIDTCSECNKVFLDLEKRWSDVILGNEDSFFKFSDVDRRYKNLKVVQGEIFSCCSEKTLNIFSEILRYAKKNYDFELEEAIELDDEMFFLVALLISSIRYDSNSCTYIKPSKILEVKFNSYEPFCKYESKYESYLIG